MVSFLLRHKCKGSHVNLSKKPRPPLELAEASAKPADGTSLNWHLGLVGLTDPALPSSKRRSPALRGDRASSLTENSTSGFT